MFLSLGFFPLDQGKSLAHRLSKFLVLEENDEDKEESESKRDEEVLEDKDLVDSKVGREQKNELETSTPNANLVELLGQGRL